MFKLQFLCLRVIGTCFHKLPIEFLVSQMVRFNRYVKNSAECLNLLVDAIGLHMGMSIPADKHKESATNIFVFPFDMRQKLIAKQVQILITDLSQNI